MACSGATKDFEPLRNSLAIQAALRGCFAGFQGRLLDVSLPCTSHARHLSTCSMMMDLQPVGQGHISWHGLFWRLNRDTLAIQVALR